MRALAALAPDLVVNTGDNLAHPDAVATAMEAMEPLLKLPGVFVMGSNDYFAPRLKNPAIYSPVTIGAGLLRSAAAADIEAGGGHVAYRVAGSQQRSR